MSVFSVKSGSGSLPGGSKGRHDFVTNFHGLHGFAGGDDDAGELMAHNKPSA